MRDTINELIDYSNNEKSKKAKKLNIYLKLGLTCFVILTLNIQFDFFSYIFTENAGEFVAGILTSIGLLFEIIGIYNNNHDVSFREHKKAVFNKASKGN